MAQDSTAPRTLADSLRSWSDADLCELLRHRPDLAAPPPADTTVLATRAGTRASVARAVDRLDRFALTVLEALVVTRSPASTGTLAAAVGSDEQVVSRGVEALRRRALVWGTDTGLHTLRAVYECLEPHPAGLGPPAAVVLAAYPPDRLATLAADTGVEPAADAAETIGRIVASWQTPGRLDALVAEAGDAARELLAHLTWGPPTGELELADRDLSRPSAASPVERLLARGVLVAVDRRTVVLPREVGLHLRQGRLSKHPVHEATPLRVVPRDPSLVDRVGAGAASEFVRRVELLLEAWGAAPPSVLRAGGLGTRELRRTASLLDVDEATAAVHVEAAYAAGLVGNGGDGRVGDVWLPTNAFDTWFTRPTAQRWSVLARAWLGSSRAAGMVGTPGSREKTVTALGPGVERPSASVIRRLSLQVVAALAPGEAADGTDVVARVRWHRPRSGPFRDRLAAWSLTEAASIGVIALDAMTTPGRALVDGQRCEELLEPLLPEPVDHVLIQADLTAVAPGPLRPELARELALVADVESRGGATVYRFTPESIRRALDAGWPAAELHALLASRSRTPVPQPLTYLVDDVSRRHGRLRVGAATTYLRCDDEAQLGELLADPRTASLRLRRIGPGVLLCDAPIDLLVCRLRELGRSPVAESADGTMLVARTESRRADGARPTELSERARPVLDEHRLVAAVHAMRAGDRVLDARPDDASVRRLGRIGAAQTVTLLRQAVESGQRLWLCYVNQHGSVFERVVEPMRVEGGLLTAYDDRSNGVRTFAVHRISSVAAVERSP